MQLLTPEKMGPVQRYRRMGIPQLVHLVVENEEVSITAMKVLYKPPALAPGVELRKTMVYLITMKKRVMNPTLLARHQL